MSGRVSGAGCVAIKKTDQMLPPEGRQRISNIILNNTGFKDGRLENTAEKGWGAGLPF